MYSSKFAAAVSRHMMPRLGLPFIWGSESSRECGEEADFVSDCTSLPWEYLSCPSLLSRRWGQNSSYAATVMGRRAGRQGFDVSYGTGFGCGNEQGSHKDVGLRSAVS